MAGSMARVVYTSDNGTDYSYHMDASNGTAVGATLATTEPDKPGRTHVRYLLARHPTTGRERRIPCPDPTNALWTGTAGATISLTDYNTNASANYVVAGRIGERRFA
jgi:hypothetical protein